MKTQPVDEFDAINGTDTSGIEPLWKFSITSPNAKLGGRYHASEEWELNGAIKSLCEDLRAFTFIDLGCGKGRSLIIARRMGFRRVVGVEFAAELAAIARRNIKITRISHATVIKDDAVDYPLPKGNLVVFLFNPFQSNWCEKSYRIWYSQELANSMRFIPIPYVLQHSMTVSS